MAALDICKADVDHAAQGVMTRPAKDMRALRSKGYVRMGLGSATG
jgi:hypothetical protein